MRIALTLIVVSMGAPAALGQWIPQASGTSARLRGVCAVSERIAWASGSGGTILRTIDGGATWERRSVPGAGMLDFRDIEAWDERTSVALSIGEGQLSRIYRTTDGGETWTLRHVNRDPQGFLDALAFWDTKHGLALGDPVNGRFVILTTDDGGETWKPIAAEGMPGALPGEGAFAASGTCLVVQGDHNAWFGTGGGRVFWSTDRGRTWTAQETPLRSGNGTSGVFSVAFWDSEHGAAVGGDFQEPGLSGLNVALTPDGGRTWTQPDGSKSIGYRSAVVLVPTSPGPTLIAVGPSGSDLSPDGGRTWTKLGDLGFHAASFAGPEAGWAVGEEGRVARFDLKAARSGPLPGQSP